MRTKQTEVRFLLETKYLDTLKERIGKEKATDVMRTALAILDWATEEAEKGRMIFSATEQGEEVHRLVMPELLYAKAFASIG